MHFGTTIAYSCSHCLAYTERLITGVTRERFARFAQPGGQLIESNHPSFILGHLSLYGPRIITELGFADQSPKIDENYMKVYSKDAKCIDDPTNTIYPDMEVVVENYFDWYRQAVECLKKVDDSVFDQPNPNEGAIKRFPTMGSMHALYLSGHMMLHLGQLSAWRRAEGMPAA